MAAPRKVELAPASVVAAVATYRLMRGQRASKDIYATARKVWRDTKKTNPALIAVTEKEARGLGVTGLDRLAMAIEVEVLLCKAAKRTTK